MIFVLAKVKEWSVKDYNCVNFIALIVGNRKLGRIRVTFSFSHLPFGLPLRPYVDLITKYYIFFWCEGYIGRCKLADRHR